jgi:UDP-N-acetylglucosamine--N-acetylmuramyl-(pentapeptide) pyrophosphoryl-undecaprenol N-acetylglucosamine transferase
MRVLFAGGGTAGHINPAIAVAGYIRSKQPDAELYYIGRKGGMEERLVPAAGINFHGIEVSGFQRQLNWENIKYNINAASQLASASRNARRLLLDIKPDVVMGTGGYVSGPVLRQAAKLGIKCCIHEQNAFAGVANKMLAPKVDAVMLAMPDAEKYFKAKNKPIVTGNPVRESVINMTKQKARGILGMDERPMILSFGGSLGARRINETVADVMAWHWKSGQIVHYHATGEYGVELMPKLLAEKGVDLNCENIHITEYIDNMDVMLAAADLVICRSGAITISELAVQGKPSVLIPSPNVAENHQYHNAMTLVSRGAAAIVEEKDLTGEKLTQTVSELITDKARLEKMSQNARKCAITDTNERIYRIIMKLYESTKK